MPAAPVFRRVLLFLYFSNFDLSRNQNLFNLLLSPFCSPSFSQNRTLFVRHCHRHTERRKTLFRVFFYPKTLFYQSERGFLMPKMLHVFGSVRSNCVRTRSARVLVAGAAACFKTSTRPVLNDMSLIKVNSL